MFEGGVTIGVDCAGGGVGIIVHEGVDGVVGVCKSGCVCIIKSGNNANPIGCLRFDV